VLSALPSVEQRLHIGAKLSGELALSALPALADRLELRLLLGRGKLSSEGVDGVFARLGCEEKRARKR
jgi:hypothetical protein